MLIPNEGFSGDQQIPPSADIPEESTRITDEDFNWMIETLADYDDTFGTELLPWLMWAIPPEDYINGLR